MPRPISYAVFCLKKKKRKLDEISDLIYRFDVENLGAGEKNDTLAFDHTPTAEIYTLSLHDALPISLRRGLAIDSTVDIFTFYVPHRHVYGEQWIKFMKSKNV